MIKKSGPVELKTVVTDARVLSLRGPVPGEAVTVPLELLPAWMAFHRVAVCGGDRERCIVNVKRLTK